VEANHPLGNIRAAGQDPVAHAAPGSADTQFQAAAKRTEAELMASLGIPPILGRSICDFCDKKESATWYYPLAQLTVPIGPFNIPVEGLGSSDGYSACDTCHDFIEAEDYVGLAKHLTYDMTDGQLPFALQSFRDRRIGPAQRL